MTFTKVEVQSGGALSVQSNIPEGLVLRGEEVHVHAGGLLEADRVKIYMDTFTVDQAGVIKASEKVIYMAHILYNNINFTCKELFNIE